MQATVIQIGNSLGFKVPDAVIKDLNIKVGTRIEMNFKQNGNVILEKN